MRHDVAPTVVAQVQAADRAANRISVDNSTGVDALGRVAFARYLLSLALRVEVDRQGAIIGIDGPWGSGKTHVLRTLEALVPEHPTENLILIKFNPWMVSGSGGLVEALLVQLAAEIATSVGVSNTAEEVRKKTSVIATKLVKYARVISTVKHIGPAANLILPGTGLVLAATGEALNTAADELEGSAASLLQKPEQLSVEASRRNVEALLRELPGRVVVAIDDLDRLPPAEVASMVQALKAVADFPNVVYLVAYDSAVTSKALESALMIADGRAYLEKIVQIELQLPEVPVRRMHRFAIQRLQDTVDVTLLSEPARADLESALPLAAALLSSPRDIERLRTKLLVALPLLQQEVNVADLVLLEAIALKAPAVIEWLRTDVAAVINARLAGLDAELDRRGLMGDRIRDAVEAATGGRQINEERPFKWRERVGAAVSMVPLNNAMGFVFDKCRGRSSERMSRSNFRRVQDFRFWYRWRCLHDHHERWTAEQVEGYAIQPLDFLGEMNRLEDLEELLANICDIGHEGLSLANSMEFAIFLNHAEQKFGTEEMIDHKMGFGAIPAFQIILEVDVQRAPATLAQLFSMVSIWFCGYALRSFQLERGLTFRERVEDGIPAWLDAASTYLDGDNWGTAQEYLSPFRLIELMHELGEPAAEALKRVDAFISRQSGRLGLLLSNFSDRPSHQNFRPEINWNLLPDPRRLLALANADSTFQTTHSHFVERVQLRIGDSKDKSSP